MSLAGIFNLDWDDEGSRGRFAFDNERHHRAIVNAIFAQHNIELPSFPLDPIPLFDLMTWGFNHQSMHSSVNGILGLTGFDLSTIDFRKPEERVVWLENHGREHQNWSRALGVP